MGTHDLKRHRAVNDDAEKLLENAINKRSHFAGGVYIE